MNSAETSGLLDRARTWIAHDPDEAARTELAAVIARAEDGDGDAHLDLADRFSGPLEFGTAGLRGPVGAGESRMNVAVVTRATAGLARYLLDTLTTTPKVAVGCDARFGSSEFYQAATQVLAGAGIEVLALPPQRPTPLTAYAVRALDADAGIMITASHNPAADNGYKVYLGGRAATGDGQGVQIVPPADAEIAARIAAAPPANEVPLATSGITAIGPELEEAFLARAATHHTGAPGQIRIALTAMHGVGGPLAVAALNRAGFADVHTVASQFDPDPTFPTIPFPNPEEAGAIDEAIALAREVSAAVVIALDPDADRCSVATPMPDGTWRQLTGDEIGAVLGWQAARDASRAGSTLACSVVSSRLLGKIAAAHGLRHAVTLTGFKWISRAPDLRFGYEEAIGYCTDPEAVRDKDGIGAAVYVASLVNELAAAERSLQDLLDDLAREHGLYATAPLVFRVDDLAVITAAMERLRTSPLTTLAGSVVVEVRDLAEGSADLPPTDGLLYLTEAGDRVVIRPSGTEPKLKCYLEVVLAVEGGEVPRAAATSRLEAIMAELTTAITG